MLLCTHHRNMSYRSQSSQNIVHALVQREESATQPKLIRGEVRLPTSVISVADIQLLFHFFLNSLSDRFSNADEYLRFEFSVLGNKGVVVLEQKTNGRTWESTHIHCLDIDTQRLVQLRQQGQPDEQIFKVYTSQFFAKWDEITTWVSTWGKRQGTDVVLP